MINLLKLTNYTFSSRFMGQWDITIQNTAGVCMGNLTSETPVSSRGHSKHWCGSIKCTGLESPVDQTAAYMCGGLMPSKLMPLSLILYQFQFNSHLQSIKSISVLSYDWHIRLPSDLFVKVFPTDVSYAFLFSPFMLHEFIASFSLIKSIVIGDNNVWSS
jgi:hypothetical protein